VRKEDKQQLSKNKPPQNFIFIKHFSLLYRYAGYFDSYNDPLSPRIFGLNKLPVQFCEDWESEDSDYHFIVCRVPRIYVNRFIHCMLKLQSAMRRAHKQSYFAFCEHFIDELDKANH